MQFRTKFADNNVRPLTQKLTLKLSKKMNVCSLSNRGNDMRCNTIGKLGSGSYQIILVLKSFSFEVQKIDIAAFVTRHDHNLHAAHGSRGRVGAYERRNIHSGGE